MKAHEFLSKVEHYLHKQGWKRSSHFVWEGSTDLYSAILLLDQQIHPAFQPSPQKEIAYKAIKQIFGLDDLTKWEENPLINKNDVFYALKETINQLKEAGL